MNQQELFNWFGGVVFVFVGIWHNYSILILIGCFIIGFMIGRWEK